MNAPAQAKEFLDSKRENLYRDSIAACIELGGIVHLEPGCVIMGYPCEDKPEVLHLAFACGEVEYIYKALTGLAGWKRIRWERQWKGGYAARERDIEEFGRHLKMARRRPWKAG